MSVSEIVFESDVEDIDEETLEEEFEESEEEEEYVKEDDADETEENEDDEDQEEEQQEDQSDAEDIQFDSDEEDTINDDADFEEGGSEGIDPNELYDEAPTKKTKTFFRRRKRVKPPTVSKNIKKKKKNQNEELVIQNYMIGDVREKTVSSFNGMTTEKNCKILEKAIFNHSVRKMEEVLGRKLKKSDLDNEAFRLRYTNIAFEIIVSMNNGIKCKEQIERLNENKTGLSSHDFRDQKFIDEQATKNIEEPPKAKPGIHRCNKCYYNKDLKDDEDRGRRTWYYELQTRSSDEPMTVFVQCLTCGFKWKC